jgi:hypothetical protein
MNASSLVSHPEESHYASTADPSGDVAVKESGEFVRTAREFLAPVADLIELLVHDGISQSHHHHFSIRQAGRPNEGIMAMPSSASTMAIWVSSSLMTAPRRGATPAFAQCLSTIRCMGLPGGRQINVSPFMADQGVADQGVADQGVDAGRNVGSPASALSGPKPALALSRLLQ